MDRQIDVKKIHKIVLDIYKEIKKICEDNGLRFFAISGTTIGAVFWKGIIPWDDDIDIALPAEDYTKFVDLCKKNKALSKHLHFTEYIWFGGKVHDDRTMFTNVYYLNNPKTYTGVSIDVVPLIGLPEDEGRQKEFVKDLIDFHKKAVLFERYGILKGYSNKKELLEKRDYFFKTYKFGTTSKVMDFSDHRYVLEAKGFLEPVVMDFEDTTIWVSSNYEQDLNTQYKNLQKNPPKERKASIHQKLSIINLQKSYLEYAKELNESPNSIKNIIDIMHFFEGFCEDGIFYRDEIIDKLTEDYNRLFEENGQLKKRIIDLESRIKPSRWQNVKAKFSKLCGSSSKS
ncbi:LicD family protein [Candidatus Saccharibacteria bacterium]|nr:LicD family protein [Candidatus Saccharibacteria bacterium]